MKGASPSTTIDIPYHECNILKKQILSICCLLFLAVHTSAVAQVLSQDSGGKSSIVYPGGTISIDVTQKSLSVDLNYLGDDSLSNNRMVWGISLKGTNKSGYAKLFQAKELVPGVSVAGTIGRIWAHDLETDKILREKRKKYVQVKEVLQKFICCYEQKINAIFKNQTAGLGDSDKRVLQSFMQKYFKGNIDTLQLHEQLSEYAQASQEKNVVSAVDYIIAAHNEYLKLLKDKEESLNDATAEVHALEEQSRYRRYWIYFNFGLDARKFKTFSAIDTTGLSSSFSYTNFKGTFCNVGINYLKGGSWLFGAALGLRKTDNFSRLEMKDFSLETTYISGNEKLKTESKSPPTKVHMRPLKCMKSIVTSCISKNSEKKTSWLGTCSIFGDHGHWTLKIQLQPTSAPERISSARQVSFRVEFI